MINGKQKIDLQNIMYDITPICKKTIICTYIYIYTHTHTHTDIKEDYKDSEMLTIVVSG